MMGNNGVSEILTTEVGESFSKHHYYYNAEDMKNVSSVINLQELNQIKEFKKFIHLIFKSLHQNSNFGGRFEIINMSFKTFSDFIPEITIFKI